MQNRIDEQHSKSIYIEKKRGASISSQKQQLLLEDTDPQRLSVGGGDKPRYLALYEKSRERESKQRNLAAKVN